MIERYSRKEIKNIWDDYNKYSIWLDIELAAAEAMEKLGAIPKGVVKKVLKPNEKGVIELNVPIINNTQKKYKFDLIFFILLFTGVSTFIILKKNEQK